MGAERATSKCPTLYLDTGHLVNIVKTRGNNSSVAEKFRASYATLDQWIHDGQVGLIFNPASPMEWVDGNATLASSTELADVVDSAKIAFEIEGDSFVYLHEVIQELSRLDPSLTLPEFEVFFRRDFARDIRRAIPSLLQAVPRFFAEGELLENAATIPIAFPCSPVRVYVERAWEFKKSRPQVLQERVDGYGAALNQDMDTFAKRVSKAISARDVVEWLKHYLKADCIVADLNPNANVDALLAAVDIGRCPAAALFLKAREKRIRAGQAAKDNDADDWVSVPIAAYADVLLTERNLRSYLHQADKSLETRVTHDPGLAVEMIEKLHRSLEHGGKEPL